MMPVMLTPIYKWTCPLCKTINTGHPVESDESAREAIYRSIHKLSEYEDLPDDFADFAVSEAPDYVRCVGCARQFAAHG